MGKPNVNINVGGPDNNHPQTYKTVILKPNIPFAQQIGSENTIYVIKWDFDLGGEEVSVPANCMLEFDGGKIYNGHLYGRVENSSLSVADFTKDSYIDEALENILNICNVAYIPSGDFRLHNVFTITEELRNKTIKGDGTTSVINVNKDAYLSTYNARFFTLDNICLNIAVGNDDPALRLNGCRYGVFSNLLIKSEADYNEENIGIGILFRRDNAETISDCASLSTFENIQIEDVKYGIYIDCSTNPLMDYVTSCNFNNILIARITDTGIVIKGKKIYQNTFNNVTVQDSFAGTIDHKAISFNGGYSNYFNNLVTWADAKGFTNNFYTLWFDGETAANTMPSFITGSLEGLIGSTGGSYIDYLQHYVYNFNINIIDSITGNSSYIGNISNDVLEKKDIGILFSLADCLQSSKQIIGSNVNIDYMGSYVKITGVPVDNQMGITFYLNSVLSNSKLGMTKIKAVVVGSVSTVTKQLYIRVQGSVGDDADTTLEYITKTGQYNNTILITDTIKEVDNDVENLRISIYSNDTSFSISSLYLIAYTDNIPFELLLGRKNVKILEQAKKITAFNKIKYNNVVPTYADNGESVFIAAAGLNKPAWYRGDSWFDANGRHHAKISGATEDRPEGTGAGGVLTPTYDIGYEYFDTDLGKPIYAKAIDTSTGEITWVDATGTEV